MHHNCIVNTYFQEAGYAKRGFASDFLSLSLNTHPLIVCNQKLSVFFHCYSFLGMTPWVVFTCKIKVHGLCISGYRIPILCDLSSYVLNVSYILILYIDAQNTWELEVPETCVTATTSASAAPSTIGLGIKTIFINVSFSMIFYKL